MTGPVVPLYFQPGCMFCDRVKEFLSRRDVPFTAREITHDDQALVELDELGHTTTPVTVIDGGVVVGFDRDRLERLLKTPNNED
jgi:glutaredoxin